MDCDEDSTCIVTETLLYSMKIFLIRWVQKCGSWHRLTLCIVPFMQNGSEAPQEDGKKSKKDLKKEAKAAEKAAKVLICPSISTPRLDDPLGTCKATPDGLNRSRYPPENNYSVQSILAVHIYDALEGGEFRREQVITTFLMGVVG